MTDIDEWDDEDDIPEGVLYKDYWRDLYIMVDGIRYLCVPRFQQPKGPYDRAFVPGPPRGDA